MIPVETLHRPRVVIGDIVEMKLDRGSIREEGFHGRCRVPVSLNSISFACDFSDFRNLGRCELDVQSTQILFEVLKRIR